MNQSTSDCSNWRRDNLAHWDDLVGVHLGPRGYDLAPLRAGQGRFDPIIEAILPALAGQRVAHLQCHIGDDSLAMAQRGADVTGLDFSPAAIAAARGLERSASILTQSREGRGRTEHAPSTRSPSFF